MVEIKITSNLKDVLRRLDAFTSKQFPLAMVQAINATAIAARVQAAEQANIKSTFDNPTPFTQKSVGVSKARKSSSVAVVYIKKIAAAYLLPLRDRWRPQAEQPGAVESQGGTLNSHGNLPRAAMEPPEGTAGRLCRLDTHAQWASREWGMAARCAQAGVSREGRWAAQGGDDRATGKAAEPRRPSENLDSVRRRLARQEAAETSARPRAKWWSGISLGTSIPL